MTPKEGALWKKTKRSKALQQRNLKAKRGESRTDLSQVDAITDKALERLVAEDEDERGMHADWTQAKLVLPQAQQSVHLRLESEIIAFFKSPGKGHLSRMQAVLKAYVDAFRPHPK